MSKLKCKEMKVLTNSPASPGDKSISSRNRSGRNVLHIPEVIIVSETLYLILQSVKLLHTWNHLIYNLFGFNPAPRCCEFSI